MTQLELNVFTEIEARFVNISSASQPLSETFAKVCLSNDRRQLISARRRSLKRVAAF